MDISKNIEYDKDLGVAIFEPSNLLDQYLIEYTPQDKLFEVYYFDNLGNEGSEYYTVEEIDMLKKFILSRGFSSNPEELNLAIQELLKY